MKILFFDGYCSLCNALVDRVIRQDRSREIRFASLQGNTAKDVLKVAPDQVDFDTVVYLREGETYKRSTAVLELLRDLGGIWRLAIVGFVFPVSIRDAVYRLVAASRYKVFGKRDSCRMPTADEKERLLP